MPLNHTSQFAELTDYQFQLIGKIVVEWANIEFMQKLILSRLLFSSEFISRTYTDRMSAVKVQDAINEAVHIQRHIFLSKVVSENILAEIEKVNQEIHKARTHRNKFAHFCWARSTDEEIFGTNFSSDLPGSKKHKNSFIVITNNELDILYKESYELIDKINNIIENIPELKEEVFSQILKTEQANPPRTAGR
jgi:hypothetical protein